MAGGYLTQTDIDGIERYVIQKCVEKDLSGVLQAYIKNYQLATTSEEVEVCSAILLL